MSFFVSFVLFKMFCCILGFCVVTLLLFVGFLMVFFVFFVCFFVIFFCGRGEFLLFMAVGVLVVFGALR